MRVAIDTRVLEFGHGGIPAYVRNLIPELLRQGHEHEYLIIASTAQEVPESFSGANVTLLRTAPPLAEHWQRDLWNRWRLPQLLRQHRADLFHQPYYPLPSRPAGGSTNVITLHDASVFAMPATYGQLRSARIRRQLRRSVRRADGIVFVSDFTKSEFARYVPATSGVLSRVIAEALPAEAAVTAVSDVSGQTPFVLAVGTATPRKNYAGLIRAFALIADRWPGNLVIAGDISRMKRDLKHEVAAGGLGSRVVLRGRVPDDELRRLLSSAAAFVYPSFYEGFGLPVLEAMNAGIPVCVAGGGALAEVAGDAAVHFDPHDTRAIADSLATILLDAHTAANLRQRGTARVKDFSWESAAAAHLDLYTAAASRLRSR